MSADTPSSPGPSRLEAPILPLSGIFYLVMGAGALLLGWLVGVPAPGLGVGGAVLPLGIGSGLLIAGASRLAAERVKLLDELVRDFRRILGPLRAHEVLGLALLSGFFEELLFRGILLPWLGLVPSSLLFGAMHLPYRPGAWPWTLFALGVGFWMGLLQLWTGSLVAPVLCHVVVNAVNLRWITRMPMDGEE